MSQKGYRVGTRIPWNDVGITTFWAVIAWAVLAYVTGAGQ